MPPMSATRVRDEWAVVAYNGGFNFSSAVNIHAHPMFRRLVVCTVVGKNERDVYGTFVGIRKKIPLLLRLIMDFISAGAVRPKLERSSAIKIVKKINITDMFRRILGGRKGG